MTLTDIIQSTGNSARPEFYSGRSFIGSDFSAEHLAKIYNQIKKEFGDDASESFKKLLAESPDLSASCFLKSLFNLSRNGWLFEEWVIISNSEALDGSIGGSLLTMTHQSHTPIAEEKQRTSQLLNQDFLKLINSTPKKRKRLQKR